MLICSNPVHRLSHVKWHIQTEIACYAAVHIENQSATRQQSPVNSFSYLFHNNFDWLLACFSVVILFYFFFFSRHPILSTYRKCAMNRSPTGTLKLKLFRRFARNVRCIILSRKVNRKWKIIILITARKLCNTKKLQQ